MTLEEGMAAEALALIGLRYRLHGRSEATGVDCVGLVALAASRAGLPIQRLPAYRLRGMTQSAAERTLVDTGFARCPDDTEPARLLLVESGPLQLHLMIETPSGLVHAHAGLGRVVLMPPPSPWPVLSRWRPRISPEGN